MEEPEDLPAMMMAKLREKAVPMIRQFLFSRPVYAFCITLCMISCGNTSNKPKSSENKAGSAKFAHEVEAEYAKGFRISYHKNYKLLEILNPFQNQVDTLRYSLVPWALADQVKIKNTREIAIPVRSVIATSTTHLALIQMLEASGIITGMAGAQYVYSKQIRDRLKQGEITDLPAGQLNKEKVLAMQPDLLIISGGQSSRFDNYRVLVNSGINVLVNTEWLENTPLGKAEWIKVMGALLNKENYANDQFNKVAKKYNKLKSAADTVKEKPSVISNMPYKGSWYVPGGDSYSAVFLKDAGADYPWKNSRETGGLQKDFEAVYEAGLKADIWVNPGAAQTQAEILAKDVRFKDFKSFKTGKIYNNNKRKKPSSGNDFWESGVVHPDIILADLIKIFHPEILPEHTLRYYQRLK